MTGRQAKAGGLNLLRQVYAELSLHLGDSYSPAELLQAAQTLIDVSRDEYGDTLFKAEQQYWGYYSLEVDKAIQTRCWWLLENERGSDNMSDERLADDENVRQRFKRLFGPNTFSIRGYW